MAAEEKKADTRYSETAYDDAFKTMQGKCDDIVIPFVNHMFNEHYDKTAVIRRLAEEHHADDVDGSNLKRITDSRFEIKFENEIKTYHTECESSKYDGSILVRIFEYDALIAREDAEKSLDTIRLKFPRSGLLLLRTSKKAPQKAKIEIELPDGQCPAYEIPIIKVSDYNIDEIFEKKLYMLLPFYAFTFEGQLDELNGSEEKLNVFIDVYNGIFERLRKEVDRGNLSSLSYNVIIKMICKVAYKLTMKQKNVQRKVGEYMGGKVLDLPEFRIYDQGKADGIKEGKAEGIKEGKAEGRAEGEEERKRLEDENKRLREEIEKYKVI